MILIDAAVVGFHCNVTSCELARVKAEPTAEAKFGVCGRGNAVGLTSILDRVQFFSAFILFSVSLHIVVVDNKGPTSHVSRIDGR